MTGHDVSRKMQLELFAIFVLAVLIVLEAGLLVGYSPRAVYAEVRDTLDGEYIPNATILAKGLWVYPGQEGRHNLGWMHGTVTVTVRADGYLPVERHIPKGRFPGDTVSCQITLTPEVASRTVADGQTEDAVPLPMIEASGLPVAADESSHHSSYESEAGSVASAGIAGYKIAEDISARPQVQDAMLWSTQAKVTVLDLYAEQPIPGALVMHGSTVVVTDENGGVILEGLRQGSVLSVHASDYAEAEMGYDGGEELSIVLRPNTLRGVVRDSRNGKPIADATVTAISAGQVVTCSVTDVAGHYVLLDLPPSVHLVVSAAGYNPLDFSLAGATEMDIELEPFEVKGIYMPLGLLTKREKVDELIELVERTELNAIVVDMKNDFGWLGYPSTVEEAQQAGAHKPEFMDIAQFMSLCRNKGIYTIARLVVFKDPTLAAAYPELAVHTADGEVWRDLEGSAWGDPFRAEVQDYNIAIAREVAMLGFDELQFDYLRFPSDGAIKELDYSRESTLESRTATIREFCARLRQELDAYAIPLSADLFGLTVWVSPEEDMGIGQRVADVAPYMDYLSPMLYPATFVKGNLGYDDPLRHPYDVIYRSCVELTRRVGTRVRPWLQHYSTNGVTYGAEEMRLQRKAAQDAQTRGWIFWHAAGKYDAQSFEPASSSGSWLTDLSSTCPGALPTAP